MRAHGEEVLRPSAFVEADQMLGIPLLRLPEIVDLHEADLGGVAVGLDVVVVVLFALDIHTARIPVALLGDALRRPVRPHAELSIAKPLRRLIVRGERFPCRLEWACGDLSGWRDVLGKCARQACACRGGGDQPGKLASGEGGMHGWRSLSTDNFKRDGVFAGLLFGQLYRQRRIILRELHLARVKQLDVLDLAGGR